MPGKSHKWEIRKAGFRNGPSGIGASSGAKARPRRTKQQILAEEQAEIHPRGGGAAIPRAVGRAAKKAYDVLPVPETTAQSRYRNQLQKSQAGLAPKPKKPVPGRSAEPKGPASKRGRAA